MEYLLLLPNRKAKYYWIDAGLLLCAMVFFFLTRWLSGILMLLMAIMGFLIRKKPYLFFSDAGVRVRMVWMRSYSWAELNSCMLKDGMLTLDFKNNRLFQEVIDSVSATSIDEPAFNSFCERKIAEAELPIKKTDEI